MDRVTFTGWMLFIASAVFFVATSIRSGDMLGLAGGILFFVACFFFLAAPRPERVNEGTDRR